MFKLFAKSHETHIADQLSAYLDGQVGAVEERQIEAHLNTCADCRAELESLQATQQLLRALPAPAIPRAFVLSRQVVPAQAASPLTGWYGRLRTATALAVVTLLLLLAGDVGQTLLLAGREATPASVVHQERSPESLQAIGAGPTPLPSSVPAVRPTQIPAPIAPPPAPTPTVARSATTLLTPAPVPTDLTLAGGTVSPTPQPQALEKPGVTATPVAVTLADRDNQAKSGNSTPVEATGETATAPGPFVMLPPIRWLEGLVLAIVLALAGGMLWIRHRAPWL